MAAIAAYIDTMPIPDNPWRGGLLEAGTNRGEDLFNDEEVGCFRCHSGPHHSDNLNHELDGSWQTPVLDGLAWTAPYLHDGSAATIEDVLQTLVKTDKMGHGSHLSDADLAALANYVRSL